ncbi:MAG: hypothetical protein LCH76_10870 [Actinobacteria bacterium]|nr:hypothetical protein [Actinomycetota bacterium]
MPETDITLNASTEPAPDPEGPDHQPVRSAWRTAWAGIRAGLGALLGLAPHVMHHIGLIAGAALLTGALGNSLLYAVGLVLSVPLLNRLRRRYNTWKAPILGVAVFTVLFGLSTFVIGPLFNPTGTQPPPPITDGHTGHHP